MYKSLLVLGFALVGCAANEAPATDALFQAQVKISDERSDTPESTEVSLVWQVTSADDYMVLQDTRLSGDQMDVLLPPSQESLNDYTYGGEYPDEARIGVAYIAVLDSSLDLLETEDALIGIAETQLLVYLDRDVQEGTWSADFLGGALEKGYHLMSVDPWTEQEEEACLEADPSGDCFEFDSLTEAATDAPILLRLDEVENLTIPNWT